MNSSLDSWQQGEVMVVETDLTDTKTKQPIDPATTTVVIQFHKPGGTTIEPAVVEEDGTWSVEQALDESGEWSGHILASGAYETKRPFGPFRVGDD